MVYDSGRGAIGAYEGSSLWTFDGTTWADVTPSVMPPPRGFTQIAYDPVRDRVVLFGGINDEEGVGLNDTWTWDGTTWTKQHPRTVPSARYGAAMAYDPVMRQIVMFGGLGSGRFRHDTWAWTGSNWKDLQPLHDPPPQYAGSMSFDPKSRELLLFGGVGATTLAGHRRTGTWTWEGQDWIERALHRQPSPRNGVALAYDASIHAVVAFGGVHVSFSGLRSRFLDETWAWSGMHWRRLSTESSPSPRYLAQAAFDPATDRLILLGGCFCVAPNYVVFHETWALAR